MILAVGALQTWRFRHYVNPDGVSYLDLADAYVSGGWNSLINAVWSPLYPWILGNALYLFKPTGYLESSLVHLINFFLLVLALISFEVFFEQLTKARSSNSIPHRAWTILGYSLFFWACLYAIGLQTVTPDLLLASGLFLGTALLLIIARKEAGWLTYVLFGLVLGVSYLAKAPMFYLGLLFILIAAILGGLRLLPRVAFCAVIFLAIGSLYFVPLSQKLGRLTFGETGRYNYIVYIGNNGQALRQRTILFESPLVYAYEFPEQVTYPYHFDPNFWREGLRPQLDLQVQLAVIKGNLKFYHQVLSSPFNFGLLLVFITLFISSAQSIRTLFDYWVVAIPGALALVMYVILPAESRYIGPPIVLLWLGLFAALQVQSTRLVKSVFSAFMILMMLSIGPQIMWHVSRLTENVIHEHWIAAETLSGLGVVAGDSVAVVGSPYQSYWARLARVNVAAEVIEPGQLLPPRGGRAAFREIDSFWSANNLTRRELYEALRNIGVRALVVDVYKETGFRATPCWQKIEGTRFQVCLIGEEPGSEASKLHETS